MKLRDYIEAGAQKAGTLTALGKMLDLTQPQISTIKAEKKPLPDKQLVQLAAYLGVPEADLIRANNLAMGKNVEFWEQWGKVAAMACFALVTSFVTPSPAQAAPLTQSEDNVICIMFNIVLLSVPSKQPLYFTTPVMARLGNRLTSVTR